MNDGDSYENSPKVKLVNQGQNQFLNTNLTTNNPQNNGPPISANESYNYCQQIMQDDSIKPFHSGLLKILYKNIE